MHSAVRFALAIGIAGSSFGYGQFAGVEKPKEIAAKPIPKPEPRRPIDTDPVSLVRSLLTNSAEDRKGALRLMGHEEIASDDPIEARLFAVNLDADPELEYIVIVHGQPNRTVALVLDKAGDAWRVVGDFSYWYHWEPNEAERFIELREIVWSGRKEMIVRDYSGGTGVGATAISIYRMNDGFLYRVFHTTEDRHSFIIGQGSTEYEHRTIEFLEHAWNEPASIIVRYGKRTEPPEQGQPVRRSSACSVYKWDAVNFIFSEERAAPPGLCSAKRE